MFTVSHVASRSFGVDDSRGQLDLAQRLHHLDLALEQRGRRDRRKALREKGQTKGGWG